MNKCYASITVVILLILSWYIRKKSVGQKKRKKIEKTQNLVG